MQYTLWAEVCRPILTVQGSNYDITALLNCIPPLIWSYQVQTTVANRYIMRAMLCASQLQVKCVCELVGVIETRLATVTILNISHTCMSDRLGVCEAEKSGVQVKVMSCYVS